MDNEQIAFEFWKTIDRINPYKTMRGLCEKTGLDYWNTAQQRSKNIVPKAAGFDLRRLATVPVEQWKEVVGNDFEANVFAKHPQLGALKQRLYGAGAVFVSMTGSGSGIYGLFKKGQQVNLSCPDCWVWQND